MSYKNKGDFIKWMARQDKYQLIRTSRNFQRKYLWNVKK